MNKTEEVIAMVAMVLKKEPEFVSAHMNDKLWDSFMRVEIMFAIEDKFGIKLTPSQMMEISTVQDIINMVEK